MAKKKAKKEKENDIIKEPELMPITRTLEVNYMPYAMSVIVSRALPEIDGFKPSHRKLLYMMYKMGLLGGARTKSANVVGSTMKLNPHGEAAIYETMIRLSRGYEALLHPFVDSKGNFGKVYSRDMAYAASRYTEVRLEPICHEVFSGIDTDTVDFVDNYDGTMREPTLLPTTFPNILVSPNLGIAVSMASNIPSFNLKEVCETTSEFIKNPDHNILSTLKGPDFAMGAELLYDGDGLTEIVEKGRGNVRLRAVWKYDAKNNCIEITEIPHTTTAEAIIDKTVNLIKSGKIKEIADIRDETDKQGLKITIDLKRSVEPDKLMARLYRQTTLIDTFSCNFNVLIEGTPHVMGIRQILDEWVSWRILCIERQIYFKLTKMKERLHLLLGLEKILLDIDKAIAIIRNTDEDAEVIPNLMVGFGIDALQAEFIAEIKLRNINKAYILNRVNETEKLKKEIEDAQSILKSKTKVKNIIQKELAEVSKKYGVPRKTKIVYEVESDMEDIDEPEDYPVHYFLTRDGYFKKVTPLSLRMSGDHKLKENDEIVLQKDGSNTDILLFFTSHHQVYRVQSDELPEIRISLLGLYIPQHLEMDEGEQVVSMAIAPKGEHLGSMIFVFEDGRIARVPFDSYYTISNRRKLVGAYSDRAPLVAMFHILEEQEIFLTSSSGRGLLVHSSEIQPKATRSTLGVRAMSLKPNQKIVDASIPKDLPRKSRTRFKAKNLPAAGALIRSEDLGQIQSELS